MLEGFRGSVLYQIVAVAALTGVRRGEILALRWSDLDVANKTPHIERVLQQAGRRALERLEQTKEHRITLKEPKTARGKRTFTIDDDLLRLLVAGRDKRLRFLVGVSDGPLTCPS